MATLGIHNDEAAIIFAQIVSEFSFLEAAMERVFGKLIGVDNAAPKLILRQIQSPSTKIDLMRAVLEKTPHNKDKSEKFDQIIDEFEEINRLRNQYVHGKWETIDGTNQLRLTRSKHDPYGYDGLVAEDFDTAELVSTRGRIIELWSRIYRDIGSAADEGPVTDSNT